MLYRWKTPFFWRCVHLHLTNVSIFAVLTCDDTVNKRKDVSAERRALAMMHVCEHHKSTDHNCPSCRVVHRQVARLVYFTAAACVSYERISI